jgi:hypothetical protein
MSVVTYLPDKLYRADKELEKLQQVVLVFLLQAVSSILAACRNDLCIIEAQVEISLKQAKMEARTNALTNSNGDHLWIRLIPVLLFELSDEEVDALGSPLWRNLIKLFTWISSRAMAFRDCSVCRSILVLLVAWGIRRVATECHIAGIRKIPHPKGRGL